MDSSYRPQSPDLSGYAPQSPDLSGYQPQSPDLSGVFPAQPFSHHHSHSKDRFGANFAENPYPYGSSPTSIPLQPHYDHLQHYNMAPSTRLKTEQADDDEYLPDAPPKRLRKTHQSLPSLDANGFPFPTEQSQLTAPLQGMSTQPSDPTLGVALKTSFPVARIKRIMQADEDIGKVAQVTPHVVSRALELFMIKLISASAAQARGGGGAGAQGTSNGGGGGGGGKGPRRILAQHMKKAIKADDTFDFLADIVNKVPDAPTKGKKDAGSDSEEGTSSAPKIPKKKGRKKKDSVDES